MTAVTKGNKPKRFVDRRDINDIIKSAKNFYLRSHDHVSNLLFYFFGLLVISFMVILVYVAAIIMDNPGPKTTSTYIVTSLFLSFFVLVGYGFYLIKQLKNALNATEFVLLSTSRTLEGFSGAYCLTNQAGKIFYYNQAFHEGFMSANTVEDNDVSGLLDQSVFGDNIAKIKDAITNSTSLKVSTGKGTVNVNALSRPEGVYSICVTN